MRHRLNVLGRYVVAAGEPCGRPRTSIERDRGTRTRAELEHSIEVVSVTLRIARRKHDLHDIFLERLRKMHVQHLKARCHDFGLRQRLGGPEQLLVRSQPALLRAIQFEYRMLAVGVGVIDHDVQQETVELGLRQRVGPLLLDGILRGHDHKEIWQRVGHRTNRDLPFAHGLEQGRLHLCRGAVDFVRQHEIMKQRTLPEHEGAGFGSIDFGARQIGRQEIGRELQPVEVALHAMAQHLDRPGLGEPRRPFDQQVPVAKQRRQHAGQQRLLTDDEARQVGFEPQELLL